MACEDVIYEFKRGDDLEIPMRLTDPNDNDNAVSIIGWTLRAQVRYSKELVDELDIVITSAGNGQFSLTKAKADTALWPTRKLKCDVEFDRGGTTVSSQTFIIDVSEDVTHD